MPLLPRPPPKLPPPPKPPPRLPLSIERSRTIGGLMRTGSELRDGMLSNRGAPCCCRSARGVSARRDGISNEGDGEACRSCRCGDCVPGSNRRQLFVSSRLRPPPLPGELRNVSRAGAPCGCSTPPAAPLRLPPKRCQPSAPPPPPPRRSTCCGCWPPRSMGICPAPRSMLLMRPPPPLLSPKRRQPLLRSPSGVPRPPLFMLLLSRCRNIGEPPPLLLLPSPALRQPFSLPGIALAPPPRTSPALPPRLPSNWRLARSCVARRWSSNETRSTRAGSRVRKNRASSRELGEPA